MTDKFDNIEELFKNSLENFEADVDPGVWENVSSQIGGQTSVPDASSSASTSGSSAFVGSVAVKSIVILGTAGLLTLGAFYFINSDTEEASKEVQEVSIDVVPQEEVQSEVGGIQDEKISLEDATTEDASKSISATAKKPIKVEIQNELGSASENEVKTQNEVKSSNGNSQTAKSVVVQPIVAEVKTEEKDPVKTEETIEKVEMSELLASIYSSEKSGKKPLHVRFENKGTQTANIRWKIAGEQMYNQEQVINHTFEKSGKYWVVVEIRDENGQKSRDSVEILVEGNGHIIIPDVFTPNGDGINDAFVVETEDIKSLRCSILDRSGNVIFQWDNVYGHWDGRDMNGKEVAPNSYFYIIEAVDNDGIMYLKRGTITLYRN